VPPAEDKEPPDTGAAGRLFLGEGLDPKLTEETPVSLLGRGQGLDLKSIVVENGPRTGTLDLSKASTVGALIRTINEAGLDLRARINDLGTGISICSASVVSMATIAAIGLAAVPARSS
jgi:hypothetical protein